MGSNYVIIVAGGSGTRMNTAIPKQFLLLNKKPVLMHTIESFANSTIQPQIILVLPKNQIGYWNTLCKEYNFRITLTITEGGDTRYQSVKNGLAKINGTEGIVAVHDAVRPLVTPKMIEVGFAAAKQHGSAIPAIAVNDSLRKIENNKNISVNRADYNAVQTPQCFELSLLKKAYQGDYVNTFTDDASVVEAMGEAIHLYDGDVANIKITTPHDLIIAEALMKVTHP